VLFLTNALQPITHNAPPRAVLIHFEISLTWDGAEQVLGRRSLNYIYKSKDSNQENSIPSKL